MKAYPEYKPSEIDWLGEIPSHWVRMPLKAVIKKSSAGTWGDEPKEDGADIVCFRVADFDYQHLSLSNRNITYRSVDEKQLQGREVKCGDIVIEKSGGGDIWPVGRAVISNYEFKATCSNFMHVISVNDKANNKYLNYLFATIYMHGLNRQYFAQTTGIQNLNVKEYLSQVVYFPSKSEQEAIATYLDDVTGKVDALIAEKQKQVEDLRVYRTSLITETVTRGLNLDAPLRPSGIDWLGEIPEQWRILKMKHCIEISNGSDPKTEGQIPVYGSGATSFKTCGEYKDGPTVLIGRKGATLHIPHWIEGKYWNVDTAFDTKVKDNYILRYFYYIACSFDYEQYKSQTTLPSMTQSAYENAYIPVPPISEQQAIAEFLDKKREKIDALIDELTKQLDELAEYKKAVISEAVTGKVDVRDWKPNN